LYPSRDIAARLLKMRTRDPEESLQRGIFSAALRAMGKIKFENMSIVGGMFREAEARREERF